MKYNISNLAADSLQSAESEGDMREIIFRQVCENGYINQETAYNVPFPACGRQAEYRNELLTAAGIENSAISDDEIAKIQHLYSRSSASVRKFCKFYGQHSYSCIYKIVHNIEKKV